MNFNNVVVEVSNSIAKVIINRPSKLNALNVETIAELHTAFDELNKNKAVKVIILTGSGEKAFVAGADIAEFANFSESQGAELAQRGQDLLFNFVENLSTPVIAAVNGFALGGGLELAMAAHFRVASSNAKIGLPEVSLGVIPGYGGTQRLAQLAGKGKAFELIMTAGMINAEDAKQYNLVNYVVELDELIPFCEKLAHKIANNSATAIAAAIKAVNAGFSTNNNGYITEIEEFGKCFSTFDFKEGTTAFLEKRKANFE
jgi:enoyl-CoA hydratase